MSSHAPRPVLIAGATASGKSALALEIAERVGGVIVNADSMQVYRDLRILTARPSLADEAAAPHRLYGHVDAAEPWSVARWLADVAAALGDIAAAGRVPIIVGGTGLYFKALTEGLSPIPPVPADLRSRWRAAAADAQPGELHARLARVDPVMAARLAPGDTQRILRALEVVEATGVSLAEWQSRPGTPLVPVAEAECIVVGMPRPELHRRADQRLDQMIAAGAVDEVAALVARRLPPDRPALRALGVAPLAAHLAGRVTLADALAAAKLETRQYIKRQETWLRKNMISWKWSEKKE